MPSKSKCRQIAQPTTKKGTQRIANSEEEWDAKPRPKKRKEPKADWTSMDTIRGLERYMGKYASMYNTYKGHCKVMALARIEMNRDV
jgi:hypothetical protein